VSAQRQNKGKAKSIVGDIKDTIREAENIEVEASHIGLCAHPAVVDAIADRLAQPEGAWI
jgi:hypothetical protein